MPLDNFLDFFKNSYSSAKEKQKYNKDIEVKPKADNNKKKRLYNHAYKPDKKPDGQEYSNRKIRGFEINLPFLEDSFVIMKNQGDNKRNMEVYNELKEECKGKAIFTERELLYVFKMISGVTKKC